MKCTWNKCGKETGQPCPRVWAKHERFSPVVLRIFFLGTEYEHLLPQLDAFVCDEHREEYNAYVRRSTTAQKAAKKRVRRRQPTEDYSI